MSATGTQPITPQIDAQPQADAQHLDLLTDDERAALTLELTSEDGEGQPIEEDDDEEEDGAGQTAAAEPAAATDAPPAGQEDAAAPPTAPAAKDPEAPAQQASGNPDAAAPQASAVPAVSQAQVSLESMASFKYEVPKDYEERVKALEGKFLDLDQKLEDGAIDQQDYNKQLRKLTHEQSALEAVASRAEIAREMAQQAQAQLAQREAAGWSQAVQALAGEINDRDGAFDYLNNAKLSMALGKQVEALMVERGLDPGQPAQDKLELLRQAHRVLMFMKTGKVDGDASAAAKQDAQVAAAQAIKDAAAARKPDLAAAAKSIANVPAADNGADQGEFAAFDKLSGVKLEAALENLARTNPAAYERYMADV